MLKAIVAVAALFFSSSALAEWAQPSLQTRTLSNTDVVVPADLAGAPSLLIIGFTSASREQTTAWSRRLAQDEVLNGLIVLYQVAILDDMPVMVRRMVVRSIRSGVPEALHDRFLIASDQVDAWKALATYAEPDSAYLVLLDSRGDVRWSVNGAPDAGSLQLLWDAVTTLEHAVEDGG